MSRYYEVPFSFNRNLGKGGAKSPRKHGVKKCLRFVDKHDLVRQAHYS
jgi:hypothetical protein